MVAKSKNGSEGQHSTYEFECSTWSWRYECCSRWSTHKIRTLDIFANFFDSFILFLAPSRCTIISFLCVLHFINRNGPKEKENSIGAIVEKWSAEEGSPPVWADIPIDFYFKLLEICPCFLLCFGREVRKRQTRRSVVNLSTVTNFLFFWVVRFSQLGWNIYVDLRSKCKPKRHTTS